MMSELFSSPRVSGRNVQENVATAISGLIDSRSKSAAASDAERRQQRCHAPDDAASRDQLDQAEDPLFRSDGGGKIIRLYPRAIAFRDKPDLPVRDKNVIRLPQNASMPQKGRKAANPQPELVTNRNGRRNDDYHHRMLENALAAAVLAVLVISGNWIVRILASVP
jgi:hypothetical protein